MRARRPLLAALTTSVLVATMAPAGAAEAASPAGPAAQAAARPYTVTLVTGDRVTVAGDRLTIHRTGGSGDVPYLAWRAAGHQYLVPSDALELVRDGGLDLRLFDLTALREFGYDDRRADLPLIVTGGQAPAAVADAAERTPLPAVDGVAAEVEKAELAAVWEDLTNPAEPATRTLAAGVSGVWLDGLRDLALDESVPQVGAPAAHAAGFDGAGTTVAVLDTGIDVTHPDLADRVVASENFTEEEDIRDLFGHGTHVASILAGTGAASGGQFGGVAPGAGLLNGKVCDGGGGCADSWILAGMQWAAEQGADVVNMSLGGPDLPGLDPIEQGVETLTAEFGTLFVIAAGNDGGDATISSPASADAAVAVGAVDKADQLAEFSSRGPRIDGALKPDLTAPGVEITAANSKDGFLGEPGEPYTTLDGTSMSTPHVAGAAAILAQQHPEWTPAQLKAALMGAAAPHPELGPYAQGAGRLDVARAISQTVTADPPSVGFDRALWPHDDDQPQSRTVTYVNGGDTDVTLSLVLATNAPEGFFTLSESSLTVPAGGTAEVTVGVDTSVGEADGFLGGHLTATGPDTVVTTPVAVDREVESYNLTLPHTDRDGAPTTNYLTTLFRLDQPGLIDVFAPEAAPTVRVPAGEYTLMSFVLPEDEEAPGVTLLAYPRLVVDGDRSVAVDAREGGPISVSVPDRSAAPTLSAVNADMTTEESGLSFSVLADSFNDVFSGQLGPDQSVAGFSSTVNSAWARPDQEGGFTGTPFTYDLAWFEVGRMLTGFTREVRQRDLAVIRAAHAVDVPGAQGWKTSFPLHPQAPGGWAVTIPEQVPFRRTEYHNTDGGVTWLKSFEEAVETEEFFDFLSYAESEPTAYRAGRTYREQWNQGVFGPVLPAAFPTVSRLGDQLVLEPILYGDGAGRIGFSAGTGTIRLFRNGQPIAEVPELFAEVEVPPGRADYRVEIEATRDDRFPLSTSTSLVWTFRSGHVPGEEPEPLPVSVVRFTPRLDQHNTVPAGRAHLVPVEVQPQPGSDAARLRRLTVEVSFDDGASWQPVPLVAGRYALVRPPDSPGFVSLRANALDRDGNAVVQTIIRAYAIE